MLVSGDTFLGRSRSNRGSFASCLHLLLADCFFHSSLSFEKPHLGVLPHGRGGDGFSSGLLDQRLGSRVGLPVAVENFLVGLMLRREAFTSSLLRRGSRLSNHRSFGGLRYRLTIASHTRNASSL